jgi:hypothetical protein
MEASDLGAHIPNCYHSVSVSLPKWSDVVGYEEKDPKVLSSMQTGYPRFRLHDDITLLNSLLKVLHAYSSEVSGWSVIIDVPLSRCGFIKLGEEKKDYTLLSEITIECLVFPNRAVADRFVDFLQKGDTPYPAETCLIGSTCSMAVFYAKPLLSKVSQQVLKYGTAHLLSSPNLQCRLSCSGSTVGRGSAVVKLLRSCRTCRTSAQGHCRFLLVDTPTCRPRMRRGLSLP